MHAAICFIRGRVGALLVAAIGLVLYLPVGQLQALQFDEAKVVARARSQYGELTARGVQDWLSMMAQHQVLPEHEKLVVTNDFWNERVRGDEDSRIWGKADYWATPVETLSKAAADCEDFVIAKYFSLVHMGVSPEKLRFIYVRARIGGLGSNASIAHMVLGYYDRPDAEPVLLDNLDGRVSPAGRRPDLTPVFSFNASGIYVPGTSGAQPVDRIGHWRDLLARMRSQGFEP